MTATVALNQKKIVGVPACYSACMKARRTWYALPSPPNDYAGVNARGALMPHLVYTRFTSL